MNKSEEILAGISEAHASADTRLIVGSRTGHVKGNHALILIPDINHSVNLLIFGRHMIDSQKLVPVRTKLFKSPVNLSLAVIS